MRFEKKETGKLAWTKPEMIESAIGSVTKVGDTVTSDGGGSCES